MKQGFYLLSVLVLTLSVTPPPTSALAATTPAPPATVYTFKFAGYYPPASPQAKASEQYFINRAKQLSKGRIKWQYFPSEQLGKGTEQLDIVGGGTSEFGALIPAFFTGKVPLLGSQDLPFLFNTDVAGHIRIASALFHQPEIADAMAKGNIKIVAASSLGTMSMFFKKPLKTLDDWKGRKVRTAGKLQSDTINALGATAQSLLSAEVYLALSTGVLDGSLWHPLSALEFKLYEVAKYAVIPYISLSGYTATQIMSLDVFNKLPKDMQDIIIQAGIDTEKYSQDAFLQQEKTAIKALAKKGMDVYFVPQKETIRWRDASRSIWDNWLKTTGAPGQRLLDFVLQELGEKK